MEVSGQLQRKRPRYPLDKRLGGPQSLSGRGGEEKNSQPPPGIDLNRNINGFSIKEIIRYHGNVRREEVLLE